MKWTDVIKGPQLTRRVQETALDFWRMVVEHNVATMVRLSGEGTWQYWPGDTGADRTLSFGYMTVTLVNRETRGGYVKREFKVSNTKVSIVVSNFLMVKRLN